MRGFVVASCLAIGISAASSPVWAQGAGLDVAAGYLNVAGGMHGVNAQVTAPLTRRWSAVGEFDWSSGFDCRGCEPRHRDIGVLAGVRYNWSPTPRVQPFWQLMAGGLRSSSDEYFLEYCCNLGRRLQPAAMVGYLALQPGGGVTVMATPRIGFRAQAERSWRFPIRRSSRASPCSPA